MVNLKEGEDSMLEDKFDKEEDCFYDKKKREQEEI